MPWIFLLILAGLSILLLSGRGSFLIAGFNTAAKEDQEKYDVKKLCRVIGSGLGFITLIVFIYAVFDRFEPVSWKIPDWIIPVSTVVSCIFMIVASNTICLRKDMPAEHTAGSGKTRGRRATAIILIVTFVFCAIVMVSGKINYTLANEKIIIDTTMWSDKEVYYNDIQSISYTDKFNKGKRSFGFGNLKLGAGTFHNAKFGKYTLYANNDCKEYIVIETADQVIVINDITPEKTRQLYTDIKDRIKP